METLNGIVNQYSKVIAINGGSIGLSMIAGERSQGFSLAPGDVVMLIQMNGSTMVWDPQNPHDPSSGDLVDLKQAGDYRQAVVQRYDESTGVVTIAPSVSTGTFDPVNADVQLVKVRICQGDAQIVDWVGAQPWRGELGTGAAFGGVVALDVAGTLFLPGAIIGGSGNVYGNFLGGRASRSQQTADRMEHWFATTAPPVECDFAGSKGESIVRRNPAWAAGHGKVCTGGGGGNCIDAGGGGGANGGNGGHGGIAASGQPLGGEGGVAVQSTGRLFLGGSGGGGHSNGSVWAGAGGRGGGIVYVRAGRVTFTDAASITVIGTPPDGNANYPTGGGGSAGGSVLLDVVELQGQAAIDLLGWSGGDAMAGGSPGGGGGGGLLRTTVAPTAINTNLLVRHQGGPSGHAAGDPRGATAGETGQIVTQEPRLKIWVDGAVIKPGGSTHGHVALTTVTPMSGLQVHVASSEPKVMVPGTVLMSSAHTASFTVSTKSTTAPCKATLIATLGSMTAIAYIEVRTAPSPGPT